MTFVDGAARVAKLYMINFIIRYSHYTEDD